MTSNNNCSSTCYRCSVPIQHLTGHTITFMNGFWSIAVICEPCQKATTIPERLQIYAARYAKRLSEDEWKQLAETVWEGK